MKITNIQAVHLTLPFRGASEFGRLMAACRVVLPLLPALAASSPFVEGERFFRRWSDLGAEELAAYVRAQLLAIKTVLKRWGA